MRESLTAVTDAVSLLSALGERGDAKLRAEESVAMDSPRTGQGRVKGGRRHVGEFGQVRKSPFREDPCLISAVAATTPNHMP